MSYETIFRGDPVRPSRVYFAVPGPSPVPPPPPPPPPPSTPPVLVGNIVGFTAEFSWTFDPGATSWRVYRGPAGGSLSLVDEVYTNSWIDSALAPGVNYDYAVTALAPETAYSNLVTLALAGGFNIAPPTEGVNSNITGLARQADGNLIIGGNFGTARGVNVNRLARLLGTDGTLDTGFNTGANVGLSSFATGIVEQPDGKIVIGGDFTAARGVTKNRIARLEADGSLDTGFNVGGTVGVGAAIQFLVLQPDGKIVIGGDFTAARGTTRNRIARLNADGSLDTFNPNANAQVYALALQPDGQVIVGGIFTSIGGATRNGIARVSATGALDTGFNVGGTIGVGGGTPIVRAASIQSDGKVIIAGQFTTVRGTARNRIARLNVDGTLDATFDASGVGADNTVFALALQPDGKVVIGGNFTTVLGVTQNGIARLNADGSLDTGFNTGATPGIAGGTALISRLVIQPDDMIVAAGNFLTARGITQNRIARFNPDGTLDQ